MTELVESDQHRCETSAARTPSLAPPAPACAGLSETEAQRLERHRQRLLHALQAQDRRALHTAKQALLRSAYHRPATAPLRRALRDLSWWMAAMLLPLRR